MSGEKCRYMEAAYPTLEVDDTCSEHRHDEPTFALARALAVVMQQPNPSDEQVGWFMDDAAAVVDDFDPPPDEWTATEPVLSEEPGVELALTINGRAYVIQENDSGGHVVCHPVALDEYRSWLCTCGMAEQERTGHSPEHQDWCDLADEDGAA